ncbi:PABS domain-containing protein [Vairimorpha necatrix]|uniref:PABS domain-containing protein n=1 Tax=Vairimorpha necatrix TaxID=6039 RepID=A0AAX4J9G0_9MICR
MIFAFLFTISCNMMGGYLNSPNDQICSTQFMDQLKRHGISVIRINNYEDTLTVVIKDEKDNGKIFVSNITKKKSKDKVIKNIIVTLHTTPLKTLKKKNFWERNYDHIVNLPFINNTFSKKILQIFAWLYKLYYKKIHVRYYYLVIDQD